MSIKNSKSQFSAALLVIGDEILSGQTKDENIVTIANFCTNKGVGLNEVRIVADDEREIVSALNALRSRYDYVFSTGGIGPTHDDITAQAVAQAFGVKLEINLRAKQMLMEQYKSKDISAARLRMARVPKGAKLIKNLVTGAPGFQIENVYVMAGVPIIMQAMLEEISLKEGIKTLSKTIVVGVGESRIAKSLEKIQNSFDNVKIGSYPQMGKYSAIVLRSIDKSALETAAKLVQTMVDKLHEENDIVLPKG